MTTATTALSTREPADEQPAPIVPTKPPVDSQGHAHLVVLPHAADSRPAWALVKRTSKGNVVAMQVDIPLSKTREHFHEIKGKLSISVEGYQHINRVMGVWRLIPLRIVGEDGLEHWNPIRVPDEHGDLARIRYLIGGWGRNAAGNLVLQWAILDYEVAAYWTHRVYEAWKGKKGQTAKSWGKLYDTKLVPDEVRNDPQTRCVPLVGGTTLACDLNHADAQDLLIDAYSEFLKKAQVNAESICWARVLRMFSGARYATWTKEDEEAGRGAHVSVTAWVTPDALAAADVEQVAAAAQAAAVDFRAQGMRVEAPGAQEAGLDEGEQADMKGEIVGTPEQTTTPQAPVSAPQDAPAPPPPTAAEPDTQQAPSPSKAVIRKRKRAATLLGEVGPETAPEILGSNGLHGLSELHILTEQGLDALITELETEVDSQKKDRARSAPKK